MPKLMELSQAIEPKFMQIDALPNQKCILIRLPSYFYGFEIQERFIEMSAKDALYLLGELKRLEMPIKKLIEKPSNSEVKNENS